MDEAEAPKDPKWKEFEHIVGLLEKCLVPGAKVKVNRKLPNLKTGHLEQCDVVILQGEAPRQTLTIVEVQKRGRKVQANDFRGWLQKLEDVGAQHLVCVSEEGFPQSAIDEAKFHGHKIRLMTLAELEGNWPIQIVGNAIHHLEIGFHGENVDLLIEGETGQLEVDRLAPVFRRGGTSKLLSLTNIIEELFDGIKDKHLLPEGESTRDCMYSRLPGQTFEIIHDSVPIPVRAIKVTLRITKKLHLIPFKVADYVQIDYKGALAYAYIAKGEVNGAEYRAELIFVPFKDGLMKLKAMRIPRLPGKNLSGLSMIRAEDPPTA